MKVPDPVTVYDLECTAKDAEDGVAVYGPVKVFYDDALNGFAYYNGPHQITRERAILMLYRV